jgi:hypothetical protein
VGGQILFGKEHANQTERVAARFGGSAHRIKKAETIMSKIKTVTELRWDLIEAYEEARLDPRRQNQVKQVANCAGKILASAKLQIEMAHMLGKEPDKEVIAFVGKPSAIDLKPQTSGLLNAPSD